MTTYTAIPDGDIDADSPITASLMTLLRDNPLGIQEGASGAPRIVRGAIAAGVGHRWFYDYGDGSDGAVTDSANRTADPGLYQYTTYQLDASYTLDLSAPGPLVIMATTSITISGTIDVDEMGAPGADVTNKHGYNGMFGGSGGGGASGSSGNLGGDTYLTAGGSNSNGSAQSAETKALLLAQPPLFPHVWNQENMTGGECHVGGGGGGYGAAAAQNGGAGGGLVILCAPSITVASGGVITADGEIITFGGTSEEGAGGGGAIIIATPSGGYSNSGSVAAAAGTNAGSGYDGGAGFVKEITLT